LRNIGTLVVGDAVTLAEPQAGVDEPGREGAEGAVQVSLRRGGGRADWAAHAALARLGLDLIRRRHGCRRTRRPSQAESYERPQSVSTRVLGVCARTVFVDTRRGRRVELRGSLHPEGAHRMNRMNSATVRSALRIAPVLLLALTLSAAAALPEVLAAAPAGTAGAGQHAAGGEATLKVPDLGSVAVGGMNGRTLLKAGLVVCALGLLFGIVIFTQLRGLPVHASMREISELIYETCKTYLITQGKFLLVLEAFIGVIIVLYFGVLLKFDASKLLIILAFSLTGTGGTSGVAWFGMRINTFANSRTAFARLAGN